MAYNTMAMGRGTFDVFPQSPPEVYSRYRSLRGKSVSTPGDLHVLGSSNNDHNKNTTNTLNRSPRSDLDSPASEYRVETGQSISSGSPRSSAKGVGSQGGNIGRRHHLGHRRAMRTLPPLPPAPANVLASRPINTSISQPGSRNTTWKSEPANKGPSRRDVHYAGAGPRAQDQVQNQMQDRVQVQVAQVPGRDRHHQDSHQDRKKYHRDHVQQDLTPVQTPDAGFHPTAAGGETKGTKESKEPREQKDPNEPNEPKQSQVSNESQIALPVSECKQQHSQASDTKKNLADEVARLEAETDRILAEQKKLDLARLQAKFATPPPKPKRPLLDKLTFFSKTKLPTGGSSQPGTPSTIVSAIFSPAFSQSSRDSSIEEPPLPPIPALKMSFIEPGGKGIVPQIDAPISASNGGERRVIVRCFSTTINLPVTADTTPVDILEATGKLTRHHINPAESVVVECYVILGLERRLRRYERVRDVMNSWDLDRQNSLLIMTRDVANTDQDLNLMSVPRTDEPPQGLSIYLYVSSKPGKWSKRWVTLLGSGQIYAAKSQNAQPSDKDSTILCHLSDFDIYAPKESEMRRNLKPPEKFCYAIKSQQKTVVFANRDNFIHFFSTDDAQQAATFYETVHGWRSWYLVNRLVDVQKKSQVPQIGLDPKNDHKTAGSRRLNMSNGETARAGPHAEEAAEEPLMNVDAFRMSQIVITPEEMKGKSSIAAGRSKSLKKKAPATVQAPKTVESEFTSSGLLGNTYDKLKQSEAGSAASYSKVKSDGPFTEAPSLLNGGISNSSSDSSDLMKIPDGGKDDVGKQDRKQLQASSWFPSAAEHSARLRSQSNHNRQPPPQQGRPRTADTAANVPFGRRHPAPLLSFTKDFPEPPRFRDGPTGIRQVPGQPLIDYATGGAARDPRNGAARSNLSRRGMPNTIVNAGWTSPPPQYPPPPPGTRARSKSSASQGRHPLVDPRQPPIPGMPNRGHPHPAERRGPPRRYQGEPLVNQAK